MPSGQILSTTSICRSLEMEFQGHTIRTDLVVLPLTGFDLILGMDWLSVNGAVINFRQRTVTVKPVEGDQFVFFASQSSGKSHVISYARARKLLRRGCQGFLASVVTTAEPPTRIPPAREVEVSIDLMPDTVPISKAPYRLAPTEMKELKD
ncbi:uncharacterized protein [Henckelia pumila]|uniref:uncharacterized protein n=1 Tax=Henckelia pumila TaxID=405737 RepID=UPI003C6E92C4